MIKFHIIKKDGEFFRYDVISEHNLDKYIKLSADNPDLFFYTPDKTLVSIINLKEKEKDYRFINEDDYADYYKSVIKDNDLLKYSNKIQDNFGNSVILNDYEDFIIRTCHIILGKIK